MMNSQPFQAHHIEHFHMRQHEIDVGVDLFKLAFDCEAGNAIAEIVYSTQGEIIAVVGFYELWKGVANVFVVPSDTVEKHGLEFMYHVKKELNRIIGDYDLRRLQTNSLADDCTDRWMLALGFNVEGELKEYSVNKDDYRLWARLK